GLKLSADSYFTRPYLLGSECSLVPLGLAENESEDQTQDGEGFSQRKAEECDRLQDALGFRLTCHTVDVSGEHGTHTDTTANGGEAVADEVEGAVDGAFHFSSFQDAISVAGCLGCFFPVRGSLGVGVCGCG